MAKYDLFFPLRGTVGNVTFKKNGVAAAKCKKRKMVRTPASMRNSLCWTNVMAIYSVLADELMQCVEGCPNKGAASNFYAKYNKKRDTMWLTKEDKYNRVSIVAEHKVSEGTLPTIAQWLDGNDCVETGIVLANDVDSSTTVGSLADDIVQNNGSFVQGDTIKILFLKQIFVLDGTIPQARMEVCNLLLDKSDASLLPVVVGGNKLIRRNGHLALMDPLVRCAVAFIHLRKAQQGWQSSTQDFLCVNDIRLLYNTEDAFENAVRSRGGFGDSEV